MPQVLVAQVLKGLAYPANAVLLGGRDWNWSTAAMWASAGATMACLAAQSYFSGPAHGFATGVRTVGQLWWALSLFFGVQVTFSVLRYTSARGPWAALHSDETKRRVRDLKA
uniref:Uncharacterized protein n=1 Tax=Phaeomonas parva TaxID=124430 RepID=A0A6U4LPP4_9STRA|mmetsp:Transcript_9655/g.28345  ORF Transcript_9655/g.28345 Transcript_9655/m.28345 type:complete len:112 (+) Transcript_9655:220-555(+)